MLGKKRNIVLCVTGAAAVIDMILGGLTYNALLVGAGACALCYVAFRTGLLWRSRETAPAVEEVEPMIVPEAAAVRHPADPDDPASLVRQMLAQERFALLLRPQIAASLASEASLEALQRLQEAMALVPDGEVVLGDIDAALDDGKLTEEEIETGMARVVAVDRFFLDRYPVTNRQFFEFVAAGGYEQPALWDASVLPAVLDFVDRSGLPGPRFWQQGCYASGHEQHPVVGICWHEALAYARWVGKRLPSDAEWVKAASWPVPISANTRLQRKYPWGETMDRRRTNLWGSGPGGTVPVTEYPDGVSVGGVQQLIGNVWEWTGGNLRLRDDRQRLVALQTPMKSIRGGAFDTYFDNQATCQFQSGENMLARKYNIGFRCALGVCDVLLPAGSEQPAGGQRAENTPVAEVAI